jgi:hypothetical protein
MKKICLICNKEFSVSPCRENFAKFCSYKCYWKDLKNRIPHNKGKKTGLIPKSAFKKGHKTWNKDTHIQTNNALKIWQENGGKVWSKDKKLPQLSGKNHWHWKGGRAKCNGYYYVLQPNHPYADVNGRISEHRLVAEKYLGRFLTSKELIHHINEDKLDNRKENLYLFSNRGIHVAYHNLLKFNPSLVIKIIESNL